MGFGPRCIVAPGPPTPVLCHSSFPLGVTHCPEFQLPHFVWLLLRDTKDFSCPVLAGEMVPTCSHHQCWVLGMASTRLSMVSGCCLVLHCCEWCWLAHSYPAWGGLCPHLCWVLGISWVSHCVCSVWACPAATCPATQSPTVLH